MIVLAVSLLAGVLLAEISIRFFGSVWFRSQLRELGLFYPAFRNTAGDDERQALLLRSGGRTLRFSLAVLLLLALMTVIAVAAPWAMVWSEFEQRAYLVAVSVFATIWWMLRRAKRNASASTETSDSGATYGVLERWLHWLALDSVSVRHLSFDLERMYALPVRCGSSVERAKIAAGPVYICGLARSGTTMLLHILNEVNDFRSLTYRDMPFVLAPNLWRLFAQYLPRPSVPVERAHGDGIHVHFDSPEGFEEVFWRTYTPRISGSHCFAVDEPAQEALDAFADYRAIVANPRAQAGPVRRYLSKNNNNLLRLRSITSDPVATVLLVYRNPIATARSLHRQHQRFCESQTEDRFVRNYMGWLAHHEFGLDHLPFCFAAQNMNPSLQPEDVNYWLDYWNAVYCYVLEHDELRFNLISHDTLCIEPSKTLESLFSLLGVDVDIAWFAERIAEPRAESSDGFNSELLLRAEATYRALLDNPKNVHTVQAC